MKKSVLIILALSLLLTACQDVEDSNKKTAEAPPVTTAATEITTADDTQEIPKISLPQISFDVDMENNAEEIPFAEGQDRAIIKGNILPVGILNNAFFYFSYNDLITRNGVVYDKVDKITLNKYNLETGAVSIVVSEIEDSSISYIPFAITGNKISYQIPAYEDGVHKNLYYTFDSVTNTNEFICENESSNRDGIHTVSAVNDSQFIDFGFVNNNSDDYYNLSYYVNVFDANEIEYSQIISGTFEGDPKTTKRLGKVTANDNKIYFLLKDGENFTDLIIRTYDTEGREISNNGGSTSNPINPGLSYNGIYDFNVFGDFITASYTGGKTFLLQKNGEEYDVVAKDVQYLKPAYSTTSNKHIFYQQTQIDGPYYHNKVYLYENGEVTGLVEADMNWMTMNDEKFIYCTPDGECFSIDL
jgi:hypothetical protein